MTSSESPILKDLLLPQDSIELPGSEVERLRSDNERLKAQIFSNESADMCGYLWKYTGSRAGLLSQTWHPRYFTLKGSTLQYFKTEMDTGKNPRGHVDLRGTILEVEGLKKARYQTFGVVTRGGESLIRVSTSEAGTLALWVAKLQAAGCAPPRMLSPEARSRSPLRSADVRWGGRRSSSSGRHRDSSTGGAQLRSRWESQQPLRERAIPEQSSVPVSDADSESTIGDVSAFRVPLRHEVVAAKRQPMVASSPIHQSSRASLLSSERVATEEQSGMLMLGCVILVTTNSRLIIENLLKYGLLYNPVEFVKSAAPPLSNLLLLGCWPGLLLAAMLALFIECLGNWWLGLERKAVKSRNNKDLSPAAARRKRRAMARTTETLLFVLNACNTCATLMLPCYIVARTTADPLPAASLTFMTIITWMKLISFAHYNADLREARREGQIRSGERSTPEAVMPGAGRPLMYPENLTAGNLAYFMVAPTLCYQMSYPRSSRFRLRWTLWNTFKLAACLCLMLFLAEQYIEPTIRNSIKPMQELDWVILAERVLKLCIPTLYIWLVMFYAMFHVWLNILAEIVGFGDREFYKDWWNAVTIGEYWRLWNMPVHKWMLRHVYYPAMRIGVHKHVAGVLVFFVSAVFHELLVGLPLHLLKAWSFIGIMSQVPLMYITDYIHKRLKSEHAGNLVFWLSFCVLGQPTALLLYWSEWATTNTR